MTPSPAAMHGMRYADLEFEDRAFLRGVRRAQLARVVDGKVQMRMGSDTGYTLPYSEAIDRAPLIVRTWWNS